MTMDGKALRADLPEGLFGIAYAVVTDQRAVKTALELVPKTLAGPLPLPLGPGNYD